MRRLFGSFRGGCCPVRHGADGVRRGVGSFRGFERGGGFAEGVGRPELTGGVGGCGTAGGLEPGEMDRGLGLGGIGDRGEEGSGIGRGLGRGVEVVAAGEGLDRCLLGTWRLDLDASIGNLRATARAAGVDTFEFTGTMEVMTAKGTTSAAYTADGLTLTVIDPVEDIEVDYVATASGRPIGAGPGPSFSGVGDLFLVQSSYACPSAHRLVVIPGSRWPRPRTSTGSGHPRVRVTRGPGSQSDRGGG